MIGGTVAPSVLLDVRPLQGPSGKRGVGSYATGLLKGLIEQGFDSQLPRRLDARRPEPELPPGRYRSAASRRRYRGNFSAYEEAVALGADLARLRPDVYHAIDLRLPGRSPCALVVTLHDLIPWAFGGSRMWGERLRYWLGRRLLRRADLVLAVSQSTADDAVRFGGVDKKRLRVVPEAVDDVFKPSDGASNCVAYWFGLESGQLVFKFDLYVSK